MTAPQAIYLVERTNSVEYEEAFGFVVQADDESAAFEMLRGRWGVHHLLEENLDDWQWDRHDDEYYTERDAAPAKGKYRTELIGWATTYVNGGRIIQRSFHHG